MLRQETCRNNLLVYSQIAAESNSSECARILMEAGASAGTRDDSGMTALTLMVKKMPSVVSKTNISMLAKNGLTCVPILKLNAVSRLGDNLPLLAIKLVSFEFVFHGYNMSLSEKKSYGHLLGEDGEMPIIKGS